MGLIFLWPVGDLSNRSRRAAKISGPSLRGTNLPN
jgi:hypothetical protein